MPDLERELFESAMGGDEPAKEVVQQSTTEVAQPATTEGERSRDEKGRFASSTTDANAKPSEAAAQEAIPQQETVGEQPQAQQQSAPKNSVPSYRLKEESDAKREALSRAEAAEKRAEELSRTVEGLQKQFFSFQQQSSRPQTEPQKVNLFENPEQWEQHQQQSVQSLLQQQSLQFSEQLARIKFGDEIYDAADKAAQAIMMSGQIDPNLVAVGRSSNPGVALVDWYKRKQTLDRLGGMDVDKFLEQEIEKRAADPQFQNKILERARAQANPTPGPANQSINNPPSLNRQISAAPTNSPIDDESDGALLKAALKR